MPSTYSTSLKLQLIGTGEQAGTWGTTTNYNLGTLLEQAITGVITIPMGDATYTLTNYNGLSDEARNAVLILQGPITAPQNLVIPPGQQKVYIVRNRTGNTVTLTTGTGSNISVANAASEVLFTDGANVYSATQFNYVNGDLTVTGNVTIGGTIAVAGNAAFAQNIYGNVSTDQWYLPRGNTAARTSSPITGVIRYNTEANFYEGYANGSWVRFLVANQGSYTINYVVIGGGGGSAGDLWQGGGGAGQFTASTTPAIPGTTVLNIVIGAGGALGSNGSTTQITGVGQGIGGGNGYGSGTYGYGGISGGNSGNGFTGGSNQTPAPLGFGNAGGGAGSSGNGGSGSSGENVGQGGNGGAGTETLITGTSQTLAGGGGGGGQTAGGTGVNGGGNGSANGAGGSSGTPNTGGGGGGGHQGGSGVVFLSMPTINYTGTTTGSPTVTTTGSNTVLKFNGSGSYTA